MPLTVTDLFCGAGGSSLGAAASGLQIVMAANHWQTAIDVHQANHPDARHDCADISAADPRRYLTTNILLASPECTNHSQARGVSRRRQDASLFDQDFDPAAEKSRATMWCVVRFAEQIPYDAIVVENVVEATKWIFWQRWLDCMTDLGYEHKVLSHNSMHHGVAQSRDRIYVVFWRKGLAPNLEFEQTGWCARCEKVGLCRQAWKNDRKVGRYRAQWIWSCTTCHHEAMVVAPPAASIIDWDLDCPRIGDRKRPLADKTRARILAGLQRYGWAPITTAGAGATFERTPGNRARPVASEPVDTQQTTATTALATPPGFLFQTAHQGRVSDLGAPHPTVCASDDRQSLVITNDHANRARRAVDEPMPTITTGGRHGILEPPPGFMVESAHGVEPGGKDKACRVRSVDDPMQAITASGSNGALVVPLRTNGQAVSADDAPAPTVTAGGNHHGLLMRNNSSKGDGAEMSTPLDEPARTMTTSGHQSLVLPYDSRSQARPATEPLPTVTTIDRNALIDLDQLVDDCGFRMLEPHEIAAAMAFPDGYIPSTYTKKDRVKLAGNAVTPPVMAWITGRLAQAVEAAA